MATPTETEVQAQLRAASDLFETFRVNVDDSLFNPGGKVDVLQQAGEGLYLPGMIEAVVETFRDNCSALLSPALARQILDPVLFEYGPLLAAASTDTQGRGSAYRQPRDLQRALYEYLHDTSQTVQSRAITYDTAATTENFSKGSIVGNGALGRLTVDEFGYNLEACTVERKQFVCRGDQNTGAQLQAETFEVYGEASSPDGIRRSAFGSGDQNRTGLVSLHAGTSGGGSYLQNSSFDSYDSNTNVFAGWSNDAGAGGTQISQDTSNIYRRPARVTSGGGSLKLDSAGAGANITVSQARTAPWRTNRVATDTPMFLRIMVNKDIGSGAGGDLVLSLGDSSVTTSLASIGAGWQEIILPFDERCWPRQFNPSSNLAVTIDWQTSTSSGYLLIDDVILAPWTQVDGTWWCLRGNAPTHIPWALDDVLAVTDTGGAPATGKIQWLFYLAGLGYLPSSGTPTIADP